MVTVIKRMPKDKKGLNRTSNFFSFAGQSMKPVISYPKSQNFETPFISLATKLFSNNFEVISKQTQLFLFCQKSNHTR